MSHRMKRRVAAMSRDGMAVPEIVITVNAEPHHPLITELEVAAVLAHNVTPRKAGRIR